MNVTSTFRFRHVHIHYRKQRVCNGSQTEVCSPSLLCRGFHLLPLFVPEKNLWQEICGVLNWAKGGSRTTDRCVLLIHKQWRVDGDFILELKQNSCPKETKVTEESSDLFTWSAAWGKPEDDEEETSVTPVKKLRAGLCTMVVHCVPLFGPHASCPSHCSCVCGKCFAELLFFPSLYVSVLESPYRVALWSFLCRVCCQNQHVSVWR